MRQMKSHNKQRQKGRADARLCFGRYAKKHEINHVIKMRILIFTISLLIVTNSYAMPAYLYSIHNKYNLHFIQFLKMKGEDNYDNIFHIDSIDQIRNNYENRKKEYKNIVPTERFITVFGNSKKIESNLCSINSSLYKHQGELNWSLIKKSSSTLYAVVKPKSTCPKIVSTLDGYGPKTKPKNYFYVQNDISSKEIITLVNSKNVIQKQARWPDKHLKWGSRGHKVMKPSLDKLQSINQIDSKKEEYLLTYSCVNGCSCLGDLVFRVKNENNKFYKVIEVTDKYGACI